MTQPHDVVIAGSSPFVAKLLAPLTEKVGVRPRVAGDPRQAFVLCHDQARLLVFEYQGDEWLSLCRELNQITDGALAIVAALPPTHMGARPALADAGVKHTLMWSGDPGQLLRLVDLALAAAPAESLPPEDSSAAPDGATLQADLDFDVDEHAPASAPSPASMVEPDAPGAPVFMPSSVWPGTILSTSDAEFLLLSTIRGTPPQLSSLRAATEKVAGSLSEMERFALRGGAMPVEPGPVRRAAALRWQVEAALQSAPAAGSPVDSAASAAVLGAIDETLASLVELAEAAPPDWRPPIEALRHVLVKEAIDFAEEVHRIAPAEPLGAPRPIRRAAGARVLPAAASPRSGKPPRTRATLWVVLAVVMAGAAVFHGWRYLRQQQAFEHPPAAPATRPGR